MFGSIFEGALSHDTRRAGGMHYTSPENIHKLIDPLFLDGLKAELAEIMSLGTVSQLYGNLDSSRSDVPKLVARGFDLKPYILRSWLRHLTYIRNICGHHDRFYNRVMTTKAGLLKADAHYDSDKEFLTFTVLKRVSERSWPDRWPDMLDGLESIARRHAGVSLVSMRFPENWREVLER